MMIDRSEHVDAIRRSLEHLPVVGMVGDGFAADEVGL